MKMPTDNHDLIVASRARLSLLDQLSWMIAIEKADPLISRLIKEERKSLGELMSKRFT